MVFILRPDARDLARGDKARHIVDVPVRLVWVDAVFDPQHLLAAEVFAQHFFDLFLALIRVAPLGEQAHLCRQHRALAVDVDGAALEHKALRAVAVHVRDLADLARDLVVLVPGEVQPVDEPAPGVELPVHCAKAALVVHNERRAAVAHPRVVALQLYDADLLGQLCPCVLILSHGCADRHLFESGDGLCDLGKGLLRGLATVAPVVVPLGPEHPHALLGFKLGGHPVPVLLRRCAGNSFCHTVSPYDETVFSRASFSRAARSAPRRSPR